MSAIKDATGQVFGRLTVLHRDHSRAERRAYWICQCSCGKLASVCGVSLRRGNTKSCGCGALESRSSSGKKHATHGQSDTPTFSSWSSMMDRCLNERSRGYQHYGARGITVCEQWRTFLGFLADMGERPAGTTLERIDNGRGYEPGNCKWATKADQSRNRSSVRLTMEIARSIRADSRGSRELAALYGVTPATIRAVRAGHIWRKVNEIGRAHV